MKNSVKRVAVVSGGNRGLGFEIVQQLASLGIRVVLTARDSLKGQQAAESFISQKLPVYFHPLDVTSPASIEILCSFLEKEFGRCDILVNCAGIFPDIWHEGKEDHEKGDTQRALQVPLSTLREAMETNTYGPLLLSQRIIPLMRKNNYGRIVNISSGLGQLSTVESGEFVAYRVSKTALNMVTRTLAAELKGENILVNSVCPGWCRTQMGGPHADRSAQEGAKGVVYLATLPNGSLSGGFFRDKKLISW